MATPSSKSAAKNGTLSITIVITLVTALVMDQGRVGFLTACPAVLTEEPPIRSPLHIQTAQQFTDAMEVLQIANGADEVDPDDIREAESLVERLGKQLKSIGSNDRYVNQEYQRLVATHVAYREISTRIEEFLGPTLMDQSTGLFTIDKAHVGPNPATHVPIHELMVELQKLKVALCKITALEASKLLGDIIAEFPGELLHTKSHEDFSLFYTDLMKLYQRLIDSMPPPAPGAAHTEPAQLTVKLIRQFLLEFIDFGTGQAVAAELKRQPDLTADTPSALKAWFLEAHGYVRERALVSGYTKPGPKLAASARKEEHPKPRAKDDTKVKRMTYEEFSSIFAGYCKPADGSDAAKTCPYPHPHKTTSHHGYDCKGMSGASAFLMLRECDCGRRRPNL